MAPPCRARQVWDLPKTRSKRIAVCDRNRRSKTCCPACKFVQIEISKIDNPKRYSLQFKFYYLPPNEEKV